MCTAIPTRTMKVEIRHFISVNWDRDERSPTEGEVICVRSRTTPKHCGSTAQREFEPRQQLASVYSPVDESVP